MKLSVMSRICRIILLCFFTQMFYNNTASAQEEENENLSKLEYMPVIGGILKTKVEFDLDNSLMRFEVRNARLNAKGKINEYFSYKAEVDLSDEGKIKMLDAYVRFTPLANLDFYMGQRKIPFSSDYMRSPADNIFANRSFLAKYINNGLRDIGFYVNYFFTSNVPVDLLIGAVNGTGNNNPQWIDKPNFAGRLAIGHENKFRIVGNAYYGEAQYRGDLAMFGGEIRYSSGSLFIESEYISRSWTDTLSTRIHDDGLYLHSYYNFVLNNCMIDLLTPTARWDLIGSSVFGNEVDAKRLTLGVNAGFQPKQFTAEIRLNYENYLMSSLPIHTDKITVEFIAKF